MSLEVVTAIINSQNVLSALAVVAFVGFGWFLDRRVWPWFTSFSQQWRADSVSLKQKSLEVQEKNDLRWYRTSDRFIEEMQTTVVTLTIVRKNAEEALKQIAGLREQLDDLEQVFFPDDPENPKL
jgi:hypothetical protein